ncbi:MAG: hypothetical protein U1E14_05165 [Geminicoccaceae bacterium]
MAEVRLEIDDALHWRLYCKAVEHGVTVAEEIVAQLRAGQVEHEPDTEQRLAEAREIRTRAGEARA